MNKEEMILRDKLLATMKEYGVKEYYTEGDLELGSMAPGLLLVNSINCNLERELFDLLYGDDEDEDSGGVILLVTDDITDLDREKCVRHLVVEEL